MSVLGQVRSSKRHTILLLLSASPHTIPIWQPQQLLTALCAWHLPGIKSRDIARYYTLLIVQIWWHQASTSFRWTGYDLGAAPVYNQLPLATSSSAGLNGGAVKTSGPTVSSSASWSVSLNGPTSTSTSPSPFTVQSTGPINSITLGVGLGLGLPASLFLLA